MQISTDVIGFYQESPVSKRTGPAALKPRLKGTKVSSRGTFSSIAIELTIDGQRALIVEGHVFSFKYQ